MTQGHSMRFNIISKKNSVQNWPLFVKHDLRDLWSNYSDSDTNNKPTYYQTSNMKVQATSRQQSYFQPFTGWDLSLPEPTIWLDKVLWPELG